MYKYPQCDVDPNLYKDFDLDRSDVDDEHKHLIPLMEELEKGELVDINNYSWSDYGYLQTYYSSKRSKKNEIIRLTFYLELRFVNHEEHWWGYVNLPKIKNAERLEKEAREQEEKTKGERRAKVIRSIVFFRELLRLFFG